MKKGKSDIFKYKYIIAQNVNSLVNLQVLIS